MRLPSVSAAGGGAEARSRRGTVPEPGCGAPVSKAGRQPGWSGSSGARCRGGGTCPDHAGWLEAVAFKHLPQGRKILVGSARFHGEAPSVAPAAISDQRSGGGSGHLEKQSAARRCRPAGTPAPADAHEVWNCGERRSRAGSSGRPGLTQAKGAAPREIGRRARNEPPARPMETSDRPTDQSE